MASNTGETIDNKLYNAMVLFNFINLLYNIYNIIGYIQPITINSKLDEWNKLLSDKSLNLEKKIKIDPFKIIFIIEKLFDDYIKQLKLKMSKQTDTDTNTELTKINNIIKLKNKEITLYNTRLRVLSKESRAKASTTMIKAANQTFRTTKEAGKDALRTTTETGKDALRNTTKAVKGFLVDKKRFARQTDTNIWKIGKKATTNTIKKVKNSNISIKGSLKNVSNKVSKVFKRNPNRYQRVALNDIANNNPNDNNTPIATNVRLLTNNEKKNEPENSISTSASGGLPNNTKKRNNKV